MLVILEKPTINKNLTKPIVQIYCSPNIRLELLSGKDTGAPGIFFHKRILQGDSFSPLLFILAIQPLTELLHNEFETLHIGDSNDNTELNYLLYMDNLGLLTRDEATLSKILRKTKNFFVKIGLV